MQEPRRGGRALPFRRAIGRRPEEPPLKRSLPVLFPYAVFAFLALVSWNRWIEPYVDTGRELMVPWRVSQGEALYRDVRFYYGPLAPFLAAATDAVAGRSLPARIALAAAIALAHIEALRRLAGRILPAVGASLSTALVVGSFFFLRPGGCHLFPYSLDTSLAVAASAWTLVLIGERRSHSSWLLATILLVVLLARPETGVAAAAAALLPTSSPRPHRRRRLGAVLGAVGISAAVYALCSLGTPLSTLRREGWLAFVFLPPEFRNVYSSFSGLDRPGLRLAELALALVMLALIVAWLLAVAALTSRSTSARVRSLGITAGLAVLVAASAVWLWPPREMAERLSLFPPLIRPLPAFLLAGGLWRLFQRIRRREDRWVFATVPDEVLLLSAYFAGRLILAAGYVGPYPAFYLPLAALAAMAGLLGLAERAARSDGLASLRGLSIGALAIFLGSRIAAAVVAYGSPGWSKVQTPVGSLFLRQPYADATAMALSELARRTSAGGRVAGFPEIGFLQYALGRSNPLAQDQFFPGHLDRSAEFEAIHRLEESTPEAFVYVNVLTIGHGPVAFGSDYLKDLDKAVRRLSRPVSSFGPGARPDERIGDPGFFIEVRVLRNRVP